MSVAIHELFRAIRSSALAPAQAMLLLLLNEYAGSGDADACWASVPTLAWELNLSVRTVRTQLDQLAAMGCITPQEREGESTVYRVTGRVPSRSRPKPKTRARTAGVQPSPPPTPAKPAAEPRQELQGDPCRICTQVPDSVPDSVPESSRPAAAATSPVAPAAGVAAAEGQLLSIQEKLHPGRGLTERDRRHLKLALDKGITVAQVERLFAWSVHSSHPHAAASRKNGWNHLQGLLKPENVALRIEAAERWWTETYGRRGEPVPAAPPVLEQRDEPRVELLPVYRPAPPPPPDRAAQQRQVEAAAAEDRMRSLELRRQRYAAMGLDARMRSAGLGIGKAAPEATCLSSK